MIELLTRLRRILIPRRHPPPSSTSSDRPPAFEDPSTAVDPADEVAVLLGLARLPLELLLQVVLYLPVESAAAVALISKHHYVALKPYVLLFDFGDDTAGKKRLLRLLEVDLADYIACHCCDILYRWKATAPRYECPRRYGRIECEHTVGLGYCPEHHPGDLPLETVAAFLRGYERGPAYGPQLEELHHQCDGALPSHRWTPDISRETAARVVNGKLLLRTSYSLPVSLQQPPESLAKRLEQLKFICCDHSTSALPGVVMDAINHLGTPSKAPRCSDYINCAECATDLRVAVLATGSDQVVAQINTWQCYGGRDIDQEDRAVQRMYGFNFAHKRCGRDVQDYSQLALPSRNLELLYNESLGDGDGDSLTNGLQQRHRWLHWWYWRHPTYKDTPGVCSYDEWP